MSGVRPAVDARWRDTSKQIGRWSPGQQQEARAYQLTARFLQESAFVDVRSILAFDPRHNPTQGAAAAGWEGRPWMSRSDKASTQLWVQGKDQWSPVGRIPKGWGVYEMPPPPYLPKWKVAVWLYDNSTMSQSAICGAIGLNKSALAPTRLGRKLMYRSWTSQAPAGAASRLEHEPSSRPRRECPRCGRFMVPRLDGALRRHRNMTGDPCEPPVVAIDEVSFFENCGVVR